MWRLQQNRLKDMTVEPERDGRFWGTAGKHAFEATYIRREERNDRSLFCKRSVPRLYGQREPMVRGYILVTLNCINTGILDSSWEGGDSNLREQNIVMSPTKPRSEKYCAGKGQKKL
jgi:hypothetical protein